MTWKNVLGLVVFLCILAPKALPAQERYNIAYAGFAGFQTPVWATKDLGLLAKYGINGDVVLLPGSTRQIQGFDRQQR